jgi:ACS family glucarate transporter-like MFS transporter
MDKRRRRDDDGRFLIPTVSRGCAVHKNSVLAAQANVAANHPASAEPAEDALRAGVPCEEPTDVRYVVLGGLCLAATIAYIQRQSIGVAESSIREEFGLSKGQMGAVMTAFFVSYALFQIPSGVMVRAWGVRRALSSFALTFSLISGLFAGCFNWLSLVVVRLMMGITQAGIFPASTTSVAKWFPPTERGMPNGAVTAFMQVGGIVGAMLTGWLIVGIGWRWMYLAYAVPGVLWAGWFYWWYRNSPTEYYLVKYRTPDGDNANGEAVRKAAEPNEPTPWSVLLMNRSMLAVCGQQFCRACAATFFGSWFTTYLLETRGVSLPSAGMLTSLPL